MAQLPYEPQYSSTCSVRPRVLKAAFGDQYEQRTADGINSINQDWNLTFTLKKTQSLILLDFFKNLKGTSNFSWISPHDILTANYVCDSWDSHLLSKDVFRIIAHVYKVFEN